MKTRQFFLRVLASMWSTAVMIAMLTPVSVGAYADGIPDDQTRFYFTCPPVTDKTITIWFYWDVQKEGQARIKGTLTISGPATSGQIATQLAAAINNKAPGANATVGDDGEVDLGLGWHPTQEPQGYQATFGSYTTIGYLEGSFNFGPDLDTGGTYLTAAGSFAVAGPNNLYASFDAPAGTSANALAAEFASVMSADGYNAHSTGASVIYDEPIGRIDFTATGPGLDYGLGTVPEPSTLALLGSACLGIGGILRYRLRAVTQTGRKVA